MPGPLPNLRSLASTLGLSHNTVALALRGDPRVKPSTAARVLALATRVGYRSNPLLSRTLSELRRHRRPEVAEELFFVNCSPWQKPEDNLTGGGYLSGCRKRAQQLGYSLSVWSLHPESTLTWPQLVRISHSRGVRGWLFWGIAFSPNELALPGDVAFVAINYALQAHAINRVITNRDFGLRETTQTLQIKPVWRDGSTALSRRKTASC